MTAFHALRASTIQFKSTHVTHVKKEALFLDHTPWSNFQKISYKKNCPFLKNNRKLCKLKKTIGNNLIIFLTYNNLVLAIKKFPFTIK